MAAYMNTIVFPIMECFIYIYIYALFIVWVHSRPVLFSCTREEYMPNFMVRWFALLLYIWEVPGSNLSLESAVLTDFSWFSSVPPG
jgi:hypothetical protein